MGLPQRTTQIAFSEDSAPHLLPRLEPGLQTFCRNFADLFRRSITVESSEQSGTFWPDVFVGRPLPWSRFAASGVIHAGALAFILTTTRLWPNLDRTYEPTSLQQEDVIYFSPSEYLQPFDSGAEASSSTPGDPVFAPQPIVSVPANSDNREQTIVTPPEVKLEKEVPLPNMVEWQSALPTVPISATSSLAPSSKTVIQPTVVEPAPELSSSLSRSAIAFETQPVGPAPNPQAAGKLTSSPGLETSVIGPPPVITEKDLRRVVDVDIAKMEVISPAPKLTVSEQRTLSGAGELAGGLGTAVVGPAPSSAGVSGASTGERLIALGIHPASLKGPVVAPNGNRRGTFEAGPTGKVGASGEPTRQGNAGLGNERQSPATFKGIPSGLRVGQAPTPGGSALAGTYSGESQIASVSRSEVSRVSGGAAVVPDEKVTDVDRQVFGARKFYSMSLNMPNLNSSGGSWVIRFAELTTSNNPGELSAPAAIRKVDPAYPLALMRENVHGTVTVRAIIRRDGSVGEVQVLRSIDERLDQYACNAISHWHFQPAMKNGTPVDIQAVVLIPFRPGRLNSSF